MNEICSRNYYKFELNCSKELYCAGLRPIYILRLSELLTYVVKTRPIFKVWLIVFYTYSLVMFDQGYDIF